jgi:hypothetical protein
MPAFVILNRRDIVSLVSLLVGIGVGWFVASRPNAKLTRHTRDLEMTFDSIENVQEICMGGMASLSVNAIQCIDSGKTQEAVQWLSFPIANYYRDYGSRAGTNTQRFKLVARIEELARTNQTVAALIKKEKSK